MQNNPYNKEQKKYTKCPYCNMYVSFDLGLKIGYRNGADERPARK